MVLAASGTPAALAGTGLALAVAGSFAHRPFAMIKSCPRPFPMLVLALLCACAQSTGSLSKSSMHGSFSKGAVALPGPSADKPVDLPGLHNVVAFAPDTWSGSVPEGEGLATLAAAGVKTVISVDGAKPDVEGAKKHGMRYVHLPIGYDSVTEVRAEELAKALQVLPGPVYMHCHHGKHRSAAAAGAACVISGRTTNEEALARMKVSGTSADYKGLFASVHEAKKAQLAELVADPRSFPEVTEVHGLTEIMTEVDVVFDLLKASRAAQFGVPKHHQDLVPHKEAARLAELMVNSKTDEDVKALPAEFHKKLDEAIAVTQALSASLLAKSSVEENEKRYKAVERSCKDCHTAFRDNRQR